MPANDGRHGRRSRRAFTTIISTAAAALSALALAACTSSAGTSSPSATASAAAATGGPAVRLTGSGSTYDAPFFNVAFPRYEQQNPGVTISYSPVGSSAGIAAITAKQVNFGASDVPMTAAEQAAAQGGPVQQVPVDLGGEAVVYNLAGLPGVHLTGPVLAQIFLGQITNWDDPAIAALNPHLAFPNAQIFVVHRSDGSGTTYIFTSYLSSVDPAWAAKVGTGKTVSWPAQSGEGAAGNPGVANAVSHIPFAIGYVESAYSKGPALLDAAIRNQAGQYVTPTPASIAGAAAQKPDITSTDFSIVNQPGDRQLPHQRVQLGARLHPPAQPGCRPGPRHHAELAHPRRAVRRRRRRLRAPPIPDPATRPHHPPAGHRPQRSPAAELNRPVPPPRPAPASAPGSAGGDRDRRQAMPAAKRRRQASERKSLSSWARSVPTAPSPSFSSSAHCVRPVAMILKPARSSARDAAASWVTTSAQSRPSSIILMTPPTWPWARRSRLITSAIV